MNKIEELKQEVRKGATYCAHLALEAFLDAENPVECASELLRAKPHMAPIVQIATQAFDHFEQGGSKEDWLARCEKLKGELKAEPQQIAKWMASHSETGERVMTCSYSELVYTAALEVAKVRPLHISTTEGRPLCEGTLLAKRLSYAEIPVTLGVDAAALFLLEACDAVWVGADAVGQAFFVNKIGTRALVLAAKVMQKPVYLLAGALKQWPKGREWHEADHPAEEVCPSAEPPLHVVNPYFERIPLDWVTHITL